MSVPIGPITSVIKNVLVHIWFPAIEDVQASFLRDTSYSKHTIKSLLIALQASRMQGFRLAVSAIGFPSLRTQDLEYPALAREDLCHIMPLNLTELRINLHQTIDLKDNDLAKLAPGRQQLESMQINNLFGWRTAGITPDDLTTFLWQCSLLDNLCVVLDTRGYTFPGPGVPIRTGQNSLRRKFFTINVADSVIEAESIPEMAALFGLSPAITFISPVGMPGR